VSGDRVFLTAWLLRPGIGNEGQWNPLVVSLFGIEGSVEVYVEAGSDYARRSDYAGATKLRGFSRATLDIVRH